MGDSLPWTSVNRRAKFDAASFILGGEIRNRTNKQTNSNRYIHYLHLHLWLLKECAAYLSEPLAALYNTSLKEGISPEVWKSAEIIPVPKITPVRSIQSDLKPIALLPVVAKVFEGFVREFVANV